MDDLLRPRGVDRGPPRKISDVILRGEYTDNLQGIPQPLSPMASIKKYVIIKDIMFKLIAIDY